jgi:hypothetical protein
VPSKRKWRTVPSLTAEGAEADAEKTRMTIKTMKKKAHKPTSTAVTILKNCFISNKFYCANLTNAENKM